MAILACQTEHAGRIGLMELFGDMIRMAMPKESGWMKKTTKTKSEIFVDSAVIGLAIALCGAKLHDELEEQVKLKLRPQIRISYITVLYVPHIKCTPGQVVQSFPRTSVELVLSWMQGKLVSPTRIH